MRFVVNVLVACLVVGLLLTWLGIDPVALLNGAWAAVQDAPRAIADAAGWAVPYILTGAIVVVPVAAVALVLRLIRQRRRPGGGDPYV
ncbi:hypothetical protein [Rhodospirillum centenum]|uniref:Uncharacterized protein n=1 Tax=Rhodospirillum centenum (strain ATCC 51521 / SW) TaxID=414684 RepID=B6IMI1_RHOCS|nr:hypothetical protein [Rhodospirillum centenum]ACI98560.1 hypothetical protein RC1_1144 [Rhodospirillum centenum SW]